ncbi:hypothetical protein B296_00010657 [Ensete ventricosum]|uniref:Glucan endo-1,3-beta-D-glucosidase n=1 Tax=Ensete ventricosum TaxID=4639 RepID=A0A426ZUJ1_ENSVE|nr:hypothetical protein B296_00010657 [Ensete ventricosum]
MENFHGTLSSLDLDRILLTPLPILSSSSPYRPVEPPPIHPTPLLTFLARTRSPLFVNYYPYFAYLKDPFDITFEYTLLNSTPPSPTQPPASSTPYFIIRSTNATPGRKWDPPNQRVDPVAKSPPRGCVELGAWVPLRVVTTRSEGCSRKRTEVGAPAALVAGDFSGVSSQIRRTFLIPFDPRAFCCRTACGFSVNVARFIC